MVWKIKQWLGRQGYRGKATEYISITIIDILHSYSGNYGMVSMLLLYQWAHPPISLIVIWYIGCHSPNHCFMALITGAARSPDYRPTYLSQQTFLTITLLGCNHDHGYALICFHVMKCFAGILGLSYSKKMCWNWQIQTY